MVPATAMLSALVTLSSSMEKLTARVGDQAQATRTAEKENMVPAAMKCTFGKLIESQLRIRRMFARLRDRRDVKGLIVVLTLDFVTKLVVISILTAWVTRRSSDLLTTLLLIPPSRLQ